MNPKEFVFETVTELDELSSGGDRRRQLFRTIIKSGADRDVHIPVVLIEVGVRNVFKVLDLEAVLGV
jgi:hypothetical protein